MIRLFITLVVVLGFAGRGENGGGQKRVEPGVSVNQGDILVSIGNLDGLSVKARVDEIDIGKIDFGMKVHVTGDAFSDIPMIGRVRKMSSNAVSQGMESPMFDVGIAVEHLTEDQKKRLRLGMSTNLSIIAYENPNALMVPLDRITVRGNEKFVHVLRKGGQTPEVVSVTTGQRNFPAANSSGWPLPGPWWEILPSFWLTSQLAPSTPGSAKQRSIPALIGIVVGIGSVIAMVSVDAIVQK